MGGGGLGASGCVTLCDMRARVMMRSLRFRQVSPQVDQPGGQGFSQIWHGLTLLDGVRCCCLCSIIKGRVQPPRPAWGMGSVPVGLASLGVVKAGPQAF